VVLTGEDGFAFRWEKNGAILRAGGGRFEPAWEKNCSSIGVTGGETKGLLRLLQQASCG